MGRAKNTLGQRKKEFEEELSGIIPLNLTQKLRIERLEKAIKEISFQQEPIKRFIIDLENKTFIQQQNEIEIKQCFEDIFQHSEFDKETNSLTFSIQLSNCKLSVIDNHYSPLPPVD